MKKTEKAKTESSAAGRRAVSGAASLPAHYWAIVDESGNLVMKDGEIGANPLYLGKHRGLAEATEKFEQLASRDQTKRRFRVARVAVEIVDE